MRRWAFVLWVVPFLMLGSTAWAGCGKSVRAPVAAEDGAGQILVSWERLHLEGESCPGSVTRAAIGSTSGGFTALGTIDTGSSDFAAPTGAYLDEDGNSWLVGVHERLAYNRYGQIEQGTGAWYVFRPAGGAFQAPVSLPADRGQQPTIAGDQAGQVVVAWNTEQGAYVAWGAPGGGLSPAVHYGGGLQLTRATIDEGGQALLVGYYPDARQFHDAKAIVVITGSAGHLSSPQVIARRSHRAGRHPLGVLSQPILATGPQGQAMIAWTAASSAGFPASGSDLLVYRSADGRFDMPVRFATGLALQASEEHALTAPNLATLDAAGQGLIIAGTLASGFREITVTAAGIPSRPSPILRSTGSQPVLADDAAGETAIVWSERTGVDGPLTLKALLGTTQQAALALESVPLPQPPGSASGNPIAVIGAAGPATAIWTEGPAGEVTAVDARNLTSAAETVQIVGDESG